MKYANFKTHIHTRRNDMNFENYTMNTAWFAVSGLSMLIVIAAISKQLVLLLGA